MMSNAKSASRASAASPDVGLLDLESAVGELFGDRLAERRLVLDEQQMFRERQPLSRAPRY